MLAASAGAATTVSSTGTATATAGATVALPGYRVTGATGTNVLVTISTTAGSLKLGSVSGMTAATGYSLPSSSATFTTLSMWGTPANANASLATLSLVAPASGSATVTVNSANYDANVTYNAANGHYYRFVSSSGTSWSSAKTAAEASTYLGKSGYLVTITSSAEDTFVQNNTTGTNIWIGHTDQGLEGLWRLANSTGMPTAEKDQKFWRAACVAAGDASTSCSNTASYSSSGSQITYANWCNTEPNNSDGTSGEDMAVTKWNSGTCWNDLRDGNTGQVNGYMIEYGDDSAFVDASAASAAQTVQVSASSPAITPGSATVRAGTAISLGAWAIANMASSTSVLATVQTTGGTLGLTTTTGLTRAPGHTGTSWTSFTQLAFRGTVADVNAALATLALTAADGATPTITVTATPTTDPTVTYHFASGHYYTRVDAAMSVSAAQTEAAAARMRGKDGYLAAITTTAENTFVESFTSGYQNLWANGTDLAVADTWRLFSQSGMPSAEQGAVMTYFDWCSGQPDNSFGEEYVSLNYANGACWNDTDAASPHPNWSAANPTGLVVEYGDDTAWSHASSPTASQTVTVDGAAPTVSGFSSADATPTNAASIAFTLTFSRAVTGVASGDFSNAGTATCTFNPGADSGTTRTVAATCTTSGTVIPVFASGGATDAVGNTGPATAATATTTITRDATAPTATLTTSQSSPMYPGTITYTLTFSEAVTGVTADDLSNAGSASTCAFAPGADSGSTRTVTITGCGPGTVTPRFALGGATDAAGNTGPTTASTAATTITIDDPAPGAPTGVTATGQDQSAIVGWSAPASIGSSAIIDYTATASPGGAFCTATAPATQCTVIALANGTTYSFTATARNATGSGTSSSAATGIPV
ncbi:MAG: fibronectin type III domain-containing protein, partial [Gemmatimonadota bacterium]